MISDPYRILTLASSGFFLTALRLVFSIVLCLFIVDLVHNIDDNHSSRIVNIALSIIVYFLDSWTSARWQRRNTLALYAVGPWFEPHLHLTFSWYCFWSSFKRLLTSYVLCGFLLHFSMDFSCSDAVTFMFAHKCLHRSFSHQTLVFISARVRISHNEGFIAPYEHFWPNTLVHSPTTLAIKVRSNVHTHSWPDLTRR